MQHAFGMKAEESLSMGRIRKVLSEKVIGQEAALSQIVPITQMYLSGLAPEGRPAGVFLLLSGGDSVKSTACTFCKSRFLRKTLSHWSRQASRAFHPGSNATSRGERKNRLASVLVEEVERRTATLSGPFVATAAKEASNSG
jgi:hypothetical protein